jgi:hypothetical protein
MLEMSRYGDLWTALTKDWSKMMESYVANDLNSLKDITTTITSTNDDGTTQEVFIRL